MAQDYQDFLQQFVIFWLVLSMSLVHLSVSMTVHLNYTSLKINRQAIPEELHVTLTGESTPLTYLRLKRTQHINPDIPVIMLNVDKDGEFLYHREKLEDKQNIGYYQDVSTDAMIEVTRVDDLVGDGSHLLLKGELNVKGKRYWLSPEGRTKRDVTLQTSLSEDVPYSLQPQATSQVNLHDYADSPKEVEREITAVDKRDKREVHSAVQPSYTPEYVSSTFWTSAFIRRRRQARRGQTIYIDIAALVDYAAYVRFSSSSKSKSAIIHTMREYFAFIYNGVDLLYQGIKNLKYSIRVRLVKLIIAESPKASWFIEKIRKKESPRDVVDVHVAIASFREFVGGPGRDVLSPYDHATVFTGYDVIEKRSPGAKGIAYVGDMCQTNGKSISVVEYDGGFQSVDTVAHELGHRQGKKCLLEKLPISTGVVDVGNRLPGQQYTADDQCKMIFGKASNVCKGQEFGSLSEICTFMACYDPSAKQCYRRWAAMGTSCGNGKLCLNGKCVSDPRASKVRGT